MYTHTGDSPLVPHLPQTRGGKGGPLWPESSRILSARQLLPGFSCSVPVWMLWKMRTCLCPLSIGETGNAQWEGTHLLERAFHFFLRLFYNIEILNVWLFVWRKMAYSCICDTSFSWTSILKHLVLFLSAKGNSAKKDVCLLCWGV